MPGIRSDMRFRIALPTGLLILGWLALSPPVSASQQSGALQDSLDRAFEFFDQREYYEADSLLRRLLPEAEQAFGDSSARVAEILDRIVGCSYKTGRSQEEESYELAEKARAIKSLLYGAEDSRTVRSLANIGVLHALGGRLDKADSIFTQGLRTLEEADDPDPKELGRVIGYLANVRTLRSDYAGAIPLIRRSLEIQEKQFGPRHPGTLTTRANLANLLSQVGEYDEARILLDEQIDILEGLGLENEDRAWAYASLGEIDLLIGDQEEALRLLRQALDIRLKCHPPDHPQIALTRRYLGAILSEMGRNEEALEYTMEGRESWARRYGPDHPQLAQFDQDLGKTYLLMGRPAEAQEALERALAVVQSEAGPEAPLTVRILADLGRASMEEGNYGAAREQLERVVEAAERAMGPDHQYVGAYHNFLARAAFLDGDFQEAFAQALESEEILTRRIRLTARALPERQALRHARLRAAPMDLSLSLVQNVRDPDAVSRVWDALIRSRSVVLDEMAARNRRPADDGGSGVDAAGSSPWSKYTEASARLANLFLSDPEGNDPEEHHRRIDRARREMEEAQRKLPADRTRDWLENSGQIGWSQLREALPEDAALVSYVLHSRYATDPVPGLETTPWYQVLVIPPGRSRPVIRDLGAAAEIDELITSWQDEVSLGAIRIDRTAAESLESYLRIAGELRARIWDPAAPFLEDASRVFVVPDGQIHLVNLASLPLGDGAYLAEAGVSILYLSTERELLHQPAPSTNTGLLVMGAPNFDSRPEPGELAFLDFDGGQDGVAAPETGPSGSTVHPPSAPPLFRSTPPDCDFMAALRFHPLSAAGEEVREVAELWESGLTTRSGKDSPAKDRPLRLLTGAEACEEAFKRLAPESGIIHIATHGYSLSGRCSSGQGGTRGIGVLVAESPEGETEAPAPAGNGPVQDDQPAQAQPSSQGRVSRDDGGRIDAAEQRSADPINPLLLSGLALAGANQRETAPTDGDDGILTAQEIASLDLSGVRWAVLSACETGGGRILDGEGVFGLRRAFEIAGARTLVTSLWPVQDTVAQRWMRAFYRAALVDGLSAADAARNATLTLLQDLRVKRSSPHPSLWAPFVASGDWR